jgi:hypothetical protein
VTNAIEALVITDRYPIFVHVVECGDLIVADIDRQISPFPLARLTHVLSEPSAKVWYTKGMESKSLAHLV